MRQYFPDLDERDFHALLRHLDSAPYVTVTPIEETANADIGALAFGPPSERFMFERVFETLADYFTGVRGLPDRLSRDLLAQAREHLIQYFAETLTRALVAALNDWDVEHHDDIPTYVRFARDVAADPTSWLQSYPVLWARAGAAANHRIDWLVQMLDRWQENRSHVAGLLDLSGDLEIARFTVGGDTHNCGQSVAILILQGGARVVYKPRPVDAEAAYHTLTGQLEARLGLQLRAPRAVAYDGHGYVEFITEETSGRADPEQLGVLACVMVALNAKDLHFENVLNVAGTPVPIDLETLLHPTRQRDRGTAEIPGNIMHRMERSVHATGLLPLLVTSGKDRGYLDISAVGRGVAYGGDPFKKYHLTKPFHSQTRVKLDIPGALPGSAPVAAPPDLAHVRDYTDRMVGAFVETYRILREHRMDLVEMISQTMSNVQLRYIHNPTTLYASLLNILTGPVPAASDEACRGLASRIAVPSRDCDVRVVRSEIAQILDGDIPYFSVSSTEREITTANGEVVGKLALTPIDEVRRNLDNLGEAHLAEQVRIIRIALSSKVPDDHTAPEAQRSSVIGQGKKSLADVLQAGAGWLLETSGPDRFSHLPHSWIGPIISANDGRPWPPGVIGYDLYSGRIGPALALAAAGRALGDESFIKGARRVFDPIARILGEDPTDLPNATTQGLGIYSGLSSTVWGLAMAQGILDVTEYAQAAQSGLRLCRDAFDAPTNGQWFDLLSGDIGVALLGRWLGKRAIDPVLNPVEAEGVLRNGLEALPPGDPGFAHGSAGFAFAAHCLADIDDGGHCDVLTHAWQHARRDIVQRLENPQRRTLSWCNGLAGFTIAAWTCGDEELMQQLLNQIGESIAKDEIGSMTLCHGSLGVYECLRWLSLQGVDHAHGRLMTDLEKTLTPQFLTTGLHEGISRYSQSPALMAGVSSTVWHLATRLDRQLSTHSPLVPGQGVCP